MPNFTTLQRLPSAPPNTFDLDPEKALAELSRREQQRYEQDYIPVENDAIASLDDTSIVKDARKNAALGFQSAGGRLQRNLMRYGVSQGAVDLRESDIGFKTDRARSTANDVNNARLDQFDRNRTLRNSLINFGRGVAGDAYQGFNSAATSAAGRENNNRMARANTSATNAQLAGTVFSAVLLGL